MKINYLVKLNNLFIKMDAAGFEPARISSVGLKSTALTNSAKHPNNINRYYVFKSFCIINFSNNI